MITILFITFESALGSGNIYISKDYCYSITDYSEFCQEQIVDLNTGMVYNKNESNQIFELYPNNFAQEDLYNHYRIERMTK